MPTPITRRGYTKRMFAPSGVSWCGDCDRPFKGGTLTYYRGLRRCPPCLKTAMDRHAKLHLGPLYRSHVPLYVRAQRYLDHGRGPSCLR